MWAITTEDVIEEDEGLSGDILPTSKVYQNL
jgi:hypothetical protein